MPAVLPRRMALVVAFGASSLAAVLPVRAEEPVETAIRAWVAALDASPDVVAGFGELTYNADMRTATIKNLSIRSEKLPTASEVSFATVTVTGYEPSADGGFSAVEIKGDDIRLKAEGVLDIHSTGVDLKNLAVPSFAPLVFDESRIFTSIVKAVEIASQTSIDSFKMSDIEVDQTYEAQKSHASFGNYELTGMKKGFVDLVTMGPFAQESPSPDGIVKMRVEKLEVRKYDLNAALAVLDADKYPGGTGDGQWRTVIGLESYRNMTVEVPSAQMRIGLFEAEDLKLRQPKQSFAPFFDQLFANPKMSDEEMSKLALNYLPSLFQAIGFGAMRMQDVDLIAPEVQRFHLGDFHINDLSSDGLGEIGIADLDAAVQDKGSFGAERLAVGGFKFPSMDAISAAIKASEAGIEADPLPLIPTMGYAEAVNVDMTEAGKKLGAVDRARLDLSSYIGPVPTEIGVDVRGLDLDMTQVDDPQARRMFAELGYDRLKADYGFHVAWREADESVTLSGFKLALQDIGSLAADVALTGLTRSAIENPKTIDQALPSLLFSRGKFVIKDGSVIDRAITMEAKKKNQAPEKFREDIAGALPLTLMLALKNPGFQQKLAPALQTFIRTPGTLTITAAPATPVPLLKVIDAINSDPRSLADMLSVDVQAEK